LEIRVILASKAPAVRFAAEELERYLPLIDETAETALLLEQDVRLDRGLRLTVAEEESQDDGYRIAFANGVGEICGSNPRSVLFGVYRFLKEAGCSFVRPGKDGEKIRPRSLCDFSVSLEERAAYRHRGVCIEGTTSYRHVQQMIDWMPKVGLNGYFHQFMAPHTFFDQWYTHRTNPYVAAEETSAEEIAAMVEATVGEIEKRGLLLHRVGHGWTCEPFGIAGQGWDPKEYDLTEEEAAPFALVHGKRGIWQGIPLNTQLCYSDPDVRKTVVDAVARYAAEHPQVHFLHVWLADEKNNHCECEECRKLRPSDHYVNLLNEIDRRLTEDGIPTKIVFLVYMDLLWAPEKNAFEHPERFVLMFAPISRTYTTPFLEDAKGSGEKVPYVRNQTVLPTKVSDNLVYLRDWQESFSGDSFDFDYHLLWDWNFDPSGYRASEVLFSDMRDLDKIGLNGMLSCQMQRAAFPTALGMVAMAEALWNRDQTFDEVSDRYLTELFGEYREEMKDYLNTLSARFFPPYLRQETPKVSAEQEANYVFLDGYLEKAAVRFAEREAEAKTLCDRKTWFYLSAHAKICRLLAAALRQRAAGNDTAAKETFEHLTEVANRLEPELHPVWDVSYFLNVVGALFRDEKRPGIE